MRALHLDFLRPVPARPWWGFALLAAGALAAAAALWRYQQVRAEVDELEAAVAQLERFARRDSPRLRAAAGDPKALVQEIRAANAVIERLAVPWDALFRELEGAAADGVALLSIQPDPAGGQVRIAGEAKRYPDVLAYVARLEAREHLANVFLAGHEVRTGAPQRPVAFSLVADWVARDAPAPAARAAKELPDAAADR
jgi:Tfp pilus assembly protein PilN